MRTDLKLEWIREDLRGKLVEIFDLEKLNKLAEETDFVQRSTSRMEGRDFVELMTTEIAEDGTVSLNGLCDSLRQINPNAEMSAQALCERINSRGAVKYLKAIFEIAIQKNILSIKDKLCPELLAPFDRVFLQDSTQCILNEVLAEHFKGSGGSASKSAVKIDLTYEVRHGVIQDICITRGRDPDQLRAKSVLCFLEAKDLVIRDLGYFSMNALSSLKEKEAYFLSRLYWGVDVFLTGAKDESALDLAAYLDQRFAAQPIIELDVHLGKERLSCRLIAYRLPEEVVNLRIKRARDVARKKGRTLTQGYICWLKFGFYITNVEKEQWPKEVVGTIYRLRWQVELTFKSWKSLLKIQFLKGTRPERIECLIYGRLITITVMTMLYSYASSYAERELGREVSSYKFIRWLNRKERLSKALFRKALDTLFRDLLHDMVRMFCKEKRKRKTSRQLLKDQVPYLETFKESAIEQAA